MAAAPPSFAPQHGHHLACQPELDDFALLLAAHLFPRLQLTEQSETTGMNGAGNIPPMLDGAFPPPRKVPAAFPGLLSQ